MEFRYGSTTDIEALFTHKRTYQENGFEFFEGYDLMSPSFFEEIKKGSAPEVGCHYLLCLDENKEVLGVLKWKRYGIPHHQYVPESEADVVESYIAIRFMDVVENERKNGIALKLINFWSENILRVDDKVVGGKATAKGNEVNIHQWMERELSQAYYISEHDVIEEWEEKNEVYEW